MFDLEQVSVRAMTAEHGIKRITGPHNYGSGPTDRGLWLAGSLALVSAHQACDPGCLYV